MSARVTAGIVGTAALAAAVGVGVGVATREPGAGAETVERVQSAAVLLRSRGVSDEAIAKRLATRLDVDEGAALAIVKQSYGARGRDERSLRTVEIHMWALAEDVATAEAAVGVAWCAPLEGEPEHTACVADQAGWFAGSLCNAQGTVRARWASLYVRPAEGRRLREAAVAGGYDGRAISRTEFEAIAGARGFHICSPAE